MNEPTESATPETDAHWDHVKGSLYWTGNRTRLKMEEMESDRNALRAECQRLRVMVSAMADPVKITVPRDLFENLIEDAIELRGERDWHKDEPRCGYQKAFLDLVARIKESIALRDA